MSRAARKIFRVMFVCTGNTCRSPMAEGILREIAGKENLEFMDVISSGVATFDGYPATSHAVAIAGKDGVDISNHHSRQLVSDLVEESDLILTMALDHYEKMNLMYPEDGDKIFMLKGFPDRIIDDGMSIGDPIGLDFDDYMKTYNEIKRELERIWPYIKKKYASKIEEHN